MKKLLFPVLLFLVYMFPLMAQDLSQSEPVPEESLTLKKGNIPQAVIKSAEQLFQGNTQIKWGVFPYELKDLGWVVNKEYNEPINHYEILFKAKDGSDIYAVFESTGELIRSKIINRNAPVPKPILTTLQKSEYKDWKIVGDVMLIKNNQKKVIEHYTVKLEKGNMKKTLHFKPTGELIS